MTAVTIIMASTAITVEDTGIMISGRNSTATTRNDTIMIYRSVSGGEAGATCSFSMTCGLISKNGHMFHVKNAGATNSVSVSRR